MLNLIYNIFFDLVQRKLASIFQNFPHSPPLPNNLLCAKQYDFRCFSSRVFHENDIECDNN